MGASYWRSKAAPIIARVLAENRGQPEAVIRRALRDAYPWGERRHHPYKVWLDEAARQLGRKPPLGTRGQRARQPKQLEAAGQAGLFDNDGPERGEEEG